MATLILAGCGGRGQSAPVWQTVRTPSFHFRAPEGWHVTVRKNLTDVSGGGQSARVATFPLARAYTEALFRKVEPELAARMQTVAAQVRGSVSGHGVVTVDGRRAHTYEVSVDGRTDRYTFVLRGKREFLLVCSASAAVCDELAASFVAV